jgi:hypothetical protein
MGFKLKSGNRPSLKGGMLDPSCSPMGVSIAVVDATPMQKSSPYYKEDDKEEKESEDFNMMDNTPEQTPTVPDDPEKSVEGPNEDNTIETGYEDNVTQGPNEDNTISEGNEEKKADDLYGVAAPEEFNFEQALDEKSDEASQTPTNPPSEPISPPPTDQEAISEDIKSESEKMEDQEKKIQEENETVKKIGTDLVSTEARKPIDKAVSNTAQNVLNKSANKIGRKTAARALLSGAGRLGARLLPGIGQIMMARDMYKLGKYAFNNRDKIAGWTNRQKTNMTNHMNDWSKA